MADETPDARKERILAKARETLKRVEMEYGSPEALAEIEARRRQSRSDEIMRRIGLSNDRERAGAVELSELPPPPRNLDRERFVTMERALELCRFAWNDVVFSRNHSGNGGPELAGNCVGKSRWLQQHLGGVLLIGMRRDGNKSERHSALLFAIEGKLFVADYGEVMPVEQYPFYVEGFNA